MARAKKVKPVEKESQLSTGRDISLNSIERIPPPNNLNACEKGVWNEIVNSLPANHFCRADTIALSTYIRAYCYAEECREHIEKEGAILMDPKSGRAYKNPWTSLLSSQQTVINLLAPKLRVTPSGRLQNTQTRVLFNTGKMENTEEEGIDATQEEAREIIR